MPIPYDLNDAYARAILAEDDLTDLAREHLTLADAHASLQERHSVVLELLSQTMRRASGAEERLAQLAGTEPWHDDRD